MEFRWCEGCGDELKNDYRIMPIREEGEALYFLFPAKVEPKEVLAAVEKKEGLSLLTWRIVCGVAVFVGVLLRTDDRLPFPVGHGVEDKA